MARHLRLRHREAHVGEEPAGATIADVLLGPRVGLGRRGPDDVEAEVSCNTFEIPSRHAR
jgi:hypothetical protein